MVMRIEITQDYLVLREISIRNLKTRMFIRLDTMQRPVHLSTLRSSILKDIIFHGGYIDYTLSKRGLRGSTTIAEVYEVIRDLDFLYTEQYKVTDKGVEYAERFNEPPLLSSGAPLVDKLAEEISKYRSHWTSVICNSPRLPVMYYESFLKADIGLQYNIFYRIKEAWIELSNEYLGFVLSIIHESLIKGNLIPRSVESTKSMCTYVNEADSIKWKGLSFIYAHGDKAVNLVLEQMINGVTPDVLISGPGGKIIVECKQGPSKTWLSKAIKQAKKYQQFTRKLILITPVNLDKEVQIELSRYYTEVIDNCNLKNIELCRNRLKNTLENKVV